MAQIDARFIKLDLNNLQVGPGGTLQQVPGTDGLTSFDVYELDLAPTFLFRYLDLPFTPVDLEGVGLYILTETGSLSARQTLGVDYAIVRDAVGGDYKRVAWDAGSSPSGGNGTAIPDSDSPPTEGMQDTLKNTYKFQVRYPD